MFRIDIQPYSNGVHELDVTPSPEDLEVDPASFSDIRVHFRLDIGSSRIYVQFQVSATATLECDRTLVDFTLPVKGSFAVIFVPPKEIDAEDTAGNLYPLDAGTENLDLTEIVRDTLLLAVPVRKIAPGAEEKDLPITFGEPAEEDIDPRWKALKGLKSDSADGDR